MNDRQQRTSRIRSVMLSMLSIIGVVGMAAMVSASVPHSFAPGEKLTAANLNADLTAIDQRLSALERLLPAGTIVAYGGPAAAAPDGAAVPPGWLLCDGSAVSRSTYASLFGAIGINFGGGDGIATFNLPDLRGVFVRGADHGAGRDLGAAERTASNPGGAIGDAVGSAQSAATAMPGTPFMIASAGAHSHTYAAPAHGPNIDRGLGSSSVWSVNSDASYSTSSDGAHTHAITGGDLETRPRNVAVNYIIKL